MAPRLPAGVGTTQLATEDAAVLLHFSLVASGQIKLRRIDGAEDRCCAESASDRRREWTRQRYSSFRIVSCTPQPWAVTPPRSPSEPFAGLTDEQMRVRPGDDLDSLAWIKWHIARMEDIILSTVLTGRDQVFDDAWKRRLRIMRPDFGIGMTSAEVSELSSQIDVGALRDYHAAVGRRTREIVGGFNARDWEGEIAVASLERAATLGAFGTRRERYVKAFPGRPRAAMLSGVALLHPSGHLGEAATVRSAGGFGSGV